MSAANQRAGVEPERGLRAAQPLSLATIVATLDLGRGRLLSAVLASVLSGFGGAAVLTLINRSLQSRVDELRGLGVKFLALAVFVLVSRWFAQSQFAALSQEVLARLRKQVSGQFAEAPYRRVEALGPARMFAVLTQDVETLSSFFTVLSRSSLHGAAILSCSGYLLLLSWQVGLSWLLVGAAGVGLHRLLGRRADARLSRARREEDAVHAGFHGLLAGAKELRLHEGRRAAFLSTLLAPAIQAVKRENAAGWRLHAASGSIRVSLFYFMMGAALFVADLPHSARSGAVLAFLYMLVPMHALVVAVPEVSRVRLALERIVAALSELGGERSEESTSACVQPAAPATVDAALVRSIDVTHRYRRELEGGVFVLGPLCLELRAREVTFLVGGNGSGKTTLAKLLVGLYAPESGRVLWNGVEVSNATREAYRQNFSAVFSDVYLFQSLLGACPPALEERARALLADLHLEHKVRIVAGAFSTTKLSAGQRKRLALLIAVLEDRPVYVFDEWAADQDPAYKRVFYRQVLPALKQRGKCVLVITHDDAYFHVADRILQLEAGRLEERPVLGAPSVASNGSPWAMGGGRNAPALSLEGPAR